MQKCFLIIWAAFAGSLLHAQETSDAENIRSLYNEALVEQRGYKWLKQLTDMGPRFAGTENATAAVMFLKDLCDSLGFETSLQKVRVPQWQRGNIAHSAYYSNGEKYPMQVCALGGSVPTPVKGLKAEVVEITDFEQLDSLDLKGKIAFYNIPMDPTYISTFFAYGSAVKQRWIGAYEASQRGAIGVIIRSLSSSVNSFPHTGSMTYADAERKIPAAAISTADAENLSRQLQTGDSTKVSLQMNCQWLDSTYSYNLIADLKGREKPGEIILTSGHIDSWDLGTGAHDDGAGSMHALESVYLLKKLGLPIKRSLRVVFFMNEEFGLNGAKTYARQSKAKGTRHVVAIESDGGGFSPRGISMVAPDSIIERIKSFRELLEPYGIHRFGQGGAGADINQIKAEDLVMIGLRPDSHRYFEVHHSARDVIENVNARELEMGSATLAAFIYLIDKYDVVAQ